MPHTLVSALASAVLLGAGAEQLAETPRSDRAPRVVPASRVASASRSAKASRVEHFALELCDPTTGAARLTGLAQWRRSDVQGGMQLELECRFLDTAEGSGEHNLAHVEKLSGAGPRLVWREWGAGAGRCLIAEWSADGTALRTREWSRGDAPHESHATGAGAVLPLYLIELAREGRASAGRFLRFDPLGSRLEPVDLAITADAGASPDTRTVELNHPDGSLAGRYRFRGSELESFQWQDGPLRARRITAEEHAAASERRP